MTPLRLEASVPGILRPLDWPLPPGIHALTTTREGGVSVGPYASLNLGDHVGDDPVAVAANRHRLAVQLPASPVWLRQVHGTAVYRLSAGLSPEAPAPEADAAWTDAPARVCAIMTADCLPVLLASADGRAVGAAHAGWRGLQAGVLDAVVAAMGGGAGLTAWLGPAIGPQAFEVGDEVRAAFVAVDGGAAVAFVAASPGKWLADLALLARRRLHRAGVAAVYGGGECTFRDASRYFSYRRDGVTGRMATLIWRDPA